jgi:hypothetical protein
MFAGVTLSSDNQWVASSVDSSFANIKGRAICAINSTAPLTVMFSSAAQNVAMDIGSGHKGHSLTAEVAGYRNDQLVFTSSFTTQAGPKGADEVHAKTTGVVDRIVIRRVAGTSTLLLDNLAFDRATDVAPQGTGAAKPR